MFVVHPRNRGRQRYCAKGPCRKARKADSQRRWLRQPQNADYFRGEDNVARVQAWRKVNPGYWRRAKKAVPAALQDRLILQVTEPQSEGSQDEAVALQDRWNEQSAVWVGLMSHLAGSTLQDDIAQMTRRLHSRGRAVLGADVPRSAYGKTPPRHRSGAACAAPV